MKPLKHSWQNRARRAEAHWNCSDELGEETYSAVSAVFPKFKDVLNLKSCQQY
jgi:hypothetical protein